MLRAFTRACQTMAAPMLSGRQALARSTVCPHVSAQSAPTWLPCPARAPISNTTERWQHTVGTVLRVCTRLSATGQVGPTSSAPDLGHSELASNLAREAAGLQGQEESTCVRVTLRKVPGDVAELLSDCLLGSGATSVVVVEHREDGIPEQEIYEEPGSGSAGLWDQCDVIAYYPLEVDPTASVAESVELVGLALPDLGGLALEPVANAQWVDQIKASYVPLQLSPRLYIVPEWSQPSDPSALNIIMQPGVAFGTGEHPTTRMCLRALEDMERTLQGATVMDYGTGSGVLALAALLLGAKSAVGTDTDTLAVRSALRNAELTGVGSHFQAFVCGPHSTDPDPLEEAGYPERQFDVVAANILRGPLLELQPRLTEYCKPGGVLLLSGILAEQVSDIREVYGPHFENIQVRVDGSWACVTATRRRQQD